MKNLNKKTVVRRASIALTTIAASVYPVFAASEGGAKSLKEVVAPIVELLNSFLAPLLLIVGAVGTLYCVLLGVKYARAEEPQDREKAKQHLKSAIIGFVLIFVLIVALNLLLPYLETWAAGYQTKL